MNNTKPTINAKPTKPTSSIRHNQRAGVARCGRCNASRFGSRRTLEQWAETHVCIAAQPPTRRDDDSDGVVIVRPAPGDKRQSNARTH